MWKAEAMPRHAAPAALALAVALILSACGGAGATALSADQAITEAKQHLDQTSGVHFNLTSSEVPAGVTTVSAADGTLTRAPAFQGTITVPIHGLTVTVDVISVDGTTWAKIPLVPGYQQIDPGDYGAPDPGSLLDPTTGISSLLPATTEVTTGLSHRGGEGNRSVLTDYHGTVPASAVAHLIPGSAGDFGATYTIDDQGYLSQAVLTGHFNGEAHPASTYTVTVSDYGTDQQISAP